MKSVRSFAGACLAIAAASPAFAQNPPWFIAEKLAAAKSEGAIVVYSAINETEALPGWKVFEEASGIKVQFVRGNDFQLNARVAIEARAGQASWDILISTGANQNPPQLLAPYDPPEAANINPAGRAKDKRWYGHSINYNAPGYNTNLVKKDELPTSFEDFATKTQWKGRVAVEGTDMQWLAGIFEFFGEERARKILGDLVKNLEPVVADGHLALARQVGAGEYALSLNNFMNLTYSVKMEGGPTDAFALDPVSVHFAQVALNPRAPHPAAALLAANFTLSKQSQEIAARFGRMPTRVDVETRPPGALDIIKGKTIVPTYFGPEDDRKWRKMFDDIFRKR